MALTRRNWLTIRCFWNWWSFPLFSWPSVIPDTFSLVIFDSRWHHKERLEANHSEGLQSQRSIDGTNAWVCKEQRICFEKVFYKVDIIYLFNSIFLVDQRTSVTLVQKTTSLEEFLDPKFHVPPSFIPQNTLQVFDAYRADISCFMLCI